MSAKVLSTPSSNNPATFRPQLGLYVHIPFCLRKCPYCSFFSLAGREDLMDRYCKALQEQLHQFARDPRVHGNKIATIFFGGGTPTMLSAHQLSDLLDTCTRCFSLEPDPEISLEVNPATVTREDFVLLFAAGFNRLSIGAQSLSDQDLNLLGRPHNAKDVRSTIDAGRQAGFTNISLDLMYGLPRQTSVMWEKILQDALQLAPDHLSIYELTIEQGTVFAQLREQGRILPPTEEVVVEMMEITFSEIGRYGMHRYEISNYALPGRQCLHNVNYWLNGPYIGAGAGAVSYLEGCRKKIIEDVEGYCRSITSQEDGWIEREKLDSEAQFRETIIMGLRMTAGVSLAALRERFGTDPVAYYGPSLSRLLREELLTLEDGRLSLSPQGLMVANRVMAELV